MPLEELQNDYFRDLFGLDEPVDSSRPLTIFDDAELVDLQETAKRFNKRPRSRLREASYSTPPLVRQKVDVGAQRVLTDADFTSGPLSQIQAVRTGIAVQQDLGMRQQDLDALRTSPQSEQKGERTEAPTKNYSFSVEELKFLRAIQTQNLPS